MVVFNEQARVDLENIFDGLLGWKTPNGQFYMTNEEVVDYHNDILNVCETLDNVPYHAKAKYPDHLLYVRRLCLYIQKKLKNNLVYYLQYC